MPRVPVEEVLATLDRPVQPRAEFAEALFARLEAELAGETFPEQVTAPVRAPAPPRRRRWVARPALAFALAAVLALTAVLFNVLPGGEQSALALIRRARARYAAVPSFSATVYTRQFGELIAEESALVDEAPEIEVVREISYRDDFNWRVDVTTNSYDDEPPAIRAATLDPAGGSFSVADGEFFATYSAANREFRVSPIDDMERADLRFQSIGLMDPDLHEFGRFTDAFFAEHCEVLGAATIAGRDTDRIHCEDAEARGTSFDAWIDSRTGLVLRYDVNGVITSSGVIPVEGTRLEVRSIDMQPTFSPGSFDVDPPTGARIVWTGAGKAPARFRMKVDPAVTARIPLRGWGQGGALVAHGSVWTAGIEGGTGETFKGGIGYIVRIDPATNEVVARMDLNPLAEKLRRCVGPLLDVNGLVDTGDAVWVLESHDACGDQALEKIDPATNEVVAQVEEPRPSDFTGGTYGAGTIWRIGRSFDTEVEGQTCYDCESEIVRLDPDTAEVLARIRVPASARRVVVAGSTVWVLASRADPGGGVDTALFLRLDPDRNRITDEVVLPVPFISGSAYGQSALWLTGTTTDGTGVLIRLDPRSGRVEATAPVDDDPLAVAAGLHVAVGEGFVWVVDDVKKALRRIDPETLRVTGRPIRVGSAPTSVTVGFGAVWVTDYFDDELLRVDVYR